MDDTAPSVARAYDDRPAAPALSPDERERFLFYAGYVAALRHLAAAADKMECSVECEGPPLGHTLQPLAEEVGQQFPALRFDYFY